MGPTLVFYEVVEETERQVTIIKNQGFEPRYVVCGYNQLVPIMGMATAMFQPSENPTDAMILGLEIIAAGSDDSIRVVCDHQTMLCYRDVIERAWQPPEIQRFPAFLPD